VKKNEPYILWLPSWYPSKIEPYNGDFIQRHAKAASLFNNIHVIYIIKDSTGIITKTVSKENHEQGRLKETIIYYYIPVGKFKLLQSFKSIKKYASLYSRVIKQVIKKDGKPQLIHLYIAYKAGLLALYTHYRYKIPYVISEQWTIYLKEARPNFWNFPVYKQTLIKKIFAKASDVMVVSNYLGSYLHNTFQIPKPILIPNVVDANVFRYALPEFQNLNRFVHISNLNYQKNPEDIIKAFALVKEKGYKFELDIIGPESMELKGLVNYYKMTEDIHFHNEMPQTKLVNFIQGSKGLILFSRYETFGCVVIEANACGVPVIASDIPVLHENIEEGVNGIFATSGDPVDLASKIVQLIEGIPLYGQEQLSIYTLQKYSLENAGRQFHNWYNKNLN
jgi:glycosyltransferase involved in cell wall biosynthesis